MPHVGDLVGTSLFIGGPSGQTSQQPAIANAAAIYAPSEGASPADLADTQALRTTVNTILVALRGAGVISS